VCSIALARSVAPLVARIVNPLRGGSMRDTAGGIECGFDFQVASDTYQTGTVGFRCCRSTTP